MEYKYLDINGKLFKLIPFEGSKYYISKDGVVINSRKRVIKPNFDKYKKPFVKLRNRGQTLYRYVKRLIYQTWSEDSYTNDRCVEFINKNSKDLILDNLAISDYWTNQFKE